MRRFLSDWEGISILCEKAPGRESFREKPLWLDVV
jgi:hypothetical protein